jgi:hypothetical protein
MSMSYCLSTKTRRFLAGFCALAAAGLLLISAARADTMIWSNGDDAGAMPGPVIQEFDAVTGALVKSFPDPAATSPSQIGRGIAVVGSSIYYSLGGSDTVYLTNTSGANLGSAFTVTVPGVIGVQSIASDGKYLYIAADGGATSISENVYKYDFSGHLIGTVTLLPSGSIVQAGRDGLEIVGNTFVANQPRGDIGPYDEFNATTGTLITPAFLNPGTFGFTGVAFDGTDYYVFDDEADPSQLVVFDALGTFLDRVTLTGLPGPNDQAFLSDLAAVVAPAIPEPGPVSVVAAGLFGFALCRRIARERGHR